MGTIPCHHFVTWFLKSTEALLKQVYTIVQFLEPLIVQVNVLKTIMIAKYGIKKCDYNFIYIGVLTMISFKNIWKYKKIISEINKEVEVKSYQKKL